jgi:hypothetical protein
MDKQREVALIQVIDTLRGELKVYQSRDTEWNRANQERQQIDISELKQADVENKKTTQQTKKRNEQWTN